MSNFLADYKTVAERLAEAQKMILEVHTEAPVMINEVLGYIRVTVVTKDTRRATGTGSFRLDAQKTVQRTNPLEDAETSALGRALVFLGYGTSKSIASRDEVVSAQERDEEPNAHDRGRVQARVVALWRMCQQRRLTISHPVRNQPLDSLRYHELVDYGKHLRKLIDDADDVPPTEGELDD